MNAQHTRLARTGAALAALGFVLASLAVVFHSTSASAYVFQGQCLGLNNSGVCVLDEPEGKNPAVHGVVSYLHTDPVMTFTIDAIDPVTEVQICMQRTEPFAEGANVCAGSHGNHVAFAHAGNVYVVDLAAAGFDDADPLYWTIHVVAGGRTLQVLAGTHSVPTTTTAPSSTTTTADPPTTTTPTTAPSTTTTTSGDTTTSAAPTTTTTPSSTTTTAVSASTSTAPATTTTSLPVRVLPSTLARTGGPHWWALLLGASLMLVGVTLLAAATLLSRTA